MILTADRSGERADAALARLSGTLTRSAAQRLLEAGQVTSRGRVLKKNDRLEAGEPLEVELPAPQPLALTAEDIPLDIVYEDGDLIVLNKPKGLVVHPAAGHWSGTLVNALLHHCRDSLSGINGALRPGIVHRIDKDTSGLLVVAKNDFAHQSLAAQLQDHSLARVYVCLVTGGMRADSGTVDAPIGRHPTDRKRMAVVADGRSAVTHWQVLERFSGYTLLECRLETGRTHQIRVHMAHIGHPIVGDLVYGRKKPELGQDTQCLHARAITFRHPRSGETVTLTCPLPPYLEALLRRLRAKG
ncbi:MAG TPA: RluA family pseudouridine synthase [Candidatus Avoscillospira avicola]|uniref:Pseudouridine synthase n=1 Tax=Candidatus Avoscillospira avicola TaxID=2840706 RepID=A0A9D1DHV5_9FIRM|nr:RluA family pseudouridine synthase [Candidatus Avoscillospira avicola]